MLGKTDRRDVVPIRGSGDFLAYWSPSILVLWWGIQCTEGWGNIDGNVSLIFLLPWLWTCCVTLHLAKCQIFSQSRYTLQVHCVLLLIYFKESVSYPRHVLWLCCVIIVVEYDTPTTTTPQPSPKCKCSPHQEMGMKWHPVKTNDMWTKSVNRRVFRCAHWGVGVRAKLSYFGEKVGVSFRLCFFSYMIGMIEVEVRHYSK